MRRNNLILLILLLSIGFAAVSTTLILNGTLNIGENSEAFDVYFSASIENGVENNKLIKDDTHLEFVKDMSIVGEKYILGYDVTNGSRNYDAEITINCTESNEHLKITNEFDTTTNLLATETRRGTLTIEVLKTYVGTTSEPTKDINITCEIVGSAVERDSLGSGTPNPKIERCSIDKPTVYENGAWKYRDNDCSEDLTEGDLITLGSESFYVYDIVGDNVKALAQYNLYVGNSCTSDSSDSCTPLEDSTGLQDERARGNGMTGERIGVVSFTTEEKYNASKEVNGETLKDNDYSISAVKEYVDAYAEKLEEFNGNVLEVRLITRKELGTLGCKSTSCYNASSYIYSTTYWTSSPNVDYENYVWSIDKYASFYSRDPYVDTGFGVRPVIKVSKFLIDGKESAPGDNKEKCSVYDPFVYEKGIWKYRDDDCSGGLTKNDLITLGTESFYVYNIEGDNIKALAQYNVDTASNLQSTSAAPVTFTTDEEYDASKVVNGETLKPNDYSISTIKKQVEAYWNRLKAIDTNITKEDVRLITIEELEALGCNKNGSYCDLTPEYINSTCYWTSSAYDNDDKFVWLVYSDRSSISGGHYSYYSDAGVRPVIEISKSLFE